MCICKLALINKRSKKFLSKSKRNYGLRARRLSEMGAVNKKEIIARMEEMKNGECPGFRLSATFGSGVVLVEINPA